MLCYLWSRFHTESIAGLCAVVSVAKSQILEKNGREGKGKGDEAGVTNCKADRGRSQPARSHRREHGVPDVPKGYQRAPTDT